MGILTSWHSQYTELWPQEARGTGNQQNLNWLQISCFLMTFERKHGDSFFRTHGSYSCVTAFSREFFIFLTVTPSLSPTDLSLLSPSVPASLLTNALPNLSKSMRGRKSLVQNCIKGRLLCTTLCLLFYASLNTSAVFTAKCCLLVLFLLAKPSIFPASVTLQEKIHIHTFLVFSTEEQSWFPGIRMISSKENICCQPRFDL